jgi:hypothetical protein
MLFSSWSSNPSRGDFETPTSPRPRRKSPLLSLEAESVSHGLVTCPFLEGQIAKDTLC